MKRLLTLLFLYGSFFAAAQEPDVLLHVMKEELGREMNELQKASVPPYFISYRVNDFHYVNIQSSFGSLIVSDINRNRILNVDVRVGDYQFDNTHPLESSMEAWRFQRMPGGAASILPLEDSKPALQHFLWMSTENAYRSALEAFKHIKSPTSKPVNTSTPDFARTEPAVYVDDTKPFGPMIDKKFWEDKTRRLSSLFLSNADLVVGEVALRAIVERRYFVSTEGSMIAQNAHHFYLYVDASIRADDGDVLPLHKTYFAFTPGELPGDEVIQKDIAIMVSKLSKLKTAPLADPYTGPAILNAQTAGVFFHEIFGHRVEGHRLRDERDGQTFKAKITEQVLPKHISVVFDPTKRSYGGQSLNGFYLYDDEGVKTAPVTAVDNGILRSFLMSRTPLAGISHSNGHGRAAAGMPVVSRQSNLIVKTTRAVAMPDLRKMLIRECKRQGKQYGYLFADVVGGFTNTERYSPNAFNIFPTEVYRIYTDGRPDELVRGVDLIGTPLAMFAEIVAAGDTPEVFHGFCGAESGNVPVSAVAPALFVKRIETQKKPKTTQDTTLLTRPSSH